MSEPIPDVVPEESELVPARELLERACSYVADEGRTVEIVGAFVGEITKGARDDRERYRFFAHAYGLVKKHRELLAAKAVEERETLTARARTEKKLEALKRSSKGKGE